MIIYEALKRDFVNDVKDDLLVTKLYNQYQEKIGQTSMNEIRSWNNSLVQMRNVVDDISIPDDSGDQYRPVYHHEQDIGLRR